MDKIWAGWTNSMLGWTKTILVGLSAELVGQTRGLVGLNIFWLDYLKTWLDKPRFTERDNALKGTPSLFEGVLSN